MKTGLRPNEVGALRLMKTFASLTNEAKSPRSLISERSERLHFFISEASSSALAEGDFIEKASFVRGFSGGYSSPWLEDSHALRLVSKLPDLRAANANHAFARKPAQTRGEALPLPPAKQALHSQCLFCWWERVDSDHRSQ